MKPPPEKSLDTGPFRKTYTIGEEIANSIIHGIGFGLSVAGLVILVVFAAFGGDTWRIVSFSIYGSSLISLYLASTLYHSFQGPRVKRVLRIIDHSSIFFLIAGTYTPFMLVSLRGTMGWIIFGVIWGLALVGIIFKAFFVHKFRILSTLVYLSMGWLCIMVLPDMLANIPRGGIIFLVIGGAFYSFGIIFYVWRTLPFNHAVWHIFVLGGSIFHYFAVLLYVLPVT
ncbi:MAG: hemolysin III family protein [Candidatus Latescibacteria bacterium]|jgi:hemolysin III|nr:hemolysin III family protein [Candidatus Latescibacterota bacterium]